METPAVYLVCFGDSLTAGYQAGPGGIVLNADTPYGGFIQKWVGARAQIIVTGICGELTSEMVKRFHREVIEAKPQITVILGGTNDLGWGISPLQICENLRQMYEAALDADIKPVGVTVPSICVDCEEVSLSQPEEIEPAQPIPGWVRDHIDKRIVLNQKIAEACKTLKIPWLDLFAETSEGRSHLLAPRFSSDGLHFNTAGYEVFAQLVWRNLFAETFGEATPGQ